MFNAITCLFVVFLSETFLKIKLNRVICRSLAVGYYRFVVEEPFEDFWTQMNGVFLGPYLFAIFYFQNFVAKQNQVTEEKLYSHFGQGIGDFLIARVKCLQKNILFHYIRYILDIINLKQHQTCDSFYFYLKIITENLPPSLQPMHKVGVVRMSFILTTLLNIVKLGYNE